MGSLKSKNASPLIIDPMTEKVTSREPNLFFLRLLLSTSRETIDYKNKDNLKNYNEPTNENNPE